MLLPLLGIWNSSWQVFGLFKARKRLLFLRFLWFIHEFSEIYTLLFLKICYNDSRFDAVLSEISANKWADFTKKSTFHRNKMPCWEDVLSRHGIFYGSNFWFYNNKTIAPTYRFILPYRFLLFQKRKQPAGKTLPSRLFLLDKTEKATHFRHFFKKKALHNCIICAVRLCGV